MVRKIQAGKRRPGITFPILYKSVPFAKKRPHLPKTGNKGGFNSSFYSTWLLFFFSEHYVREKRTTFRNVLSCPENST